MGLHDRPYWQEQQQQGGFGGGPPGGTAFRRPQMPQAVKFLLIANVVIYILQVFLDRPVPGYPVGRISAWFGVTVGGYWQLWRYVSFQFLHGGPWHLGFNMLALFFLGGLLERTWGKKVFLTFYLSCGVVAGLAYVAIGGIYGLPADMPIIGASGGVYGILLACAVLFPHIKLLLYFILPISIRVLSVVIFGAMMLLVLQALVRGQAMSDVAHLGGAIGAAFWLWILPQLRSSVSRSRTKINDGAWKRKMQQKQAEQDEIDRILDKIRREGLGNLSHSEKHKLQEATRRQRKEP